MAERGRHATRVVLDASVWLKLFIAEPDSVEAATLVEGEDQHVAPDLLFVEFANVLWLKRRQGALSATQAEQAVDGLLQLFGVFDIVWPVELMSDAIDLAIELDHPVYDCFYLALAQRLDVPLVTADRAFWRMVRRRRPGAKIRLLGT
jgi:predicted nucleic acid-binding protein